MASACALTLMLCGSGAALQPPMPTSTSFTGRRALLRSAFAATTAAVLPSLPALVQAKDKGYMTMSEYQAIKAQGVKDEKLYGLFSTLSTRATQVGEFEKLASEGDFSGISKLALAWDQTIRQDVLDKANKELTGADKDAGAKISKAVLADLTKLDKLAKAKSVDEVAGAAASLKEHVLQFVALEPQRLTDRFGVSDL
jgi:hypothetical protein